MNNLSQRLRSEAKVAEAWEAPDVAALLNEAVDALERLTPTGEDKKKMLEIADWHERQLSFLPEKSEPYQHHAESASMIRRYVLQEKQP